MNQSSSIPFVGVKSEIDVRASRYMRGVYLLMASGVALSGLVAYTLLATGLMPSLIATGGQAFAWGVFGVQLLTLLAFGPIAQNASIGLLYGLFYFYAAVTGITLGFAGMVYSAASMINVFFMAAFAFAGLVVFGQFTKRSLGVIGTFASQALLMLLAMSLIFAIMTMVPAAAPYLPSLDFGLASIGIVIFAGLTAYESQKVRRMAYDLAERTVSDATEARYTVMFALNMYLNFINLFLNALRLFGRRR